MDKNIENITEDLMMRYVEGDLSSDEAQKFKKILSHNEYLSNRVSILKSIVDKKPMKSPSTRVHGKILSDIGLADDSSISIIRRFIDSFMSSFESRPGLAGSFLSVFVIAVISSIVIYNSVNLENNNQRNITDDPIEKDEDLDDSLTT
tara:strand:+ start:2160 stop:2603 length:444 start_codon:yes stop_codon:yes gene_type:complete